MSSSEIEIDYFDSHTISLWRILNKNRLLKITDFKDLQMSQNQVITTLWTHQSVLYRLVINHVIGVLIWVASQPVSSWGQSLPKDHHLTISLAASLSALCLDKNNIDIMAPGPFSGLLAPFMGARKSKKYEKLQTEDPEKKRQEATQEEINRLHSKIVST